MTSAAAVKRSGKKCARFVSLLSSFRRPACVACSSCTSACPARRLTESWKQQVKLCLNLPRPAVQRRDSDDGATQKKPRVVWSAEMHQQFVEAVEKLGVDSAHLNKLPGYSFAANRQCTSTLCLTQLVRCNAFMWLQSELSHACACCTFGWLSNQGKPKVPMSAWCSAGQHGVLLSTQSAGHESWLVLSGRSCPKAHSGRNECGGLDAGECGQPLAGVA